MSHRPRRFGSESERRPEALWLAPAARRPSSLTTDRICRTPGRLPRSVLPAQVTCAQATGERSGRPFDPAAAGQARGITVSSADEFKDWLRAWFTSFSDARPDEARYLEGNDFTLALFQGRGINDGPLGELPPTNRQMDLPFAELLEYDADGKVRYGAIYYDQVTMLTQLGHMPPQGG